MNQDENSQPLAVTLSREELLVVLDVLRAGTIPGLDREPSGELPPDQVAFTLVVARRALLARELAQVREDGELLLHRALLSSIGACAYAQKSVLVYHWPAGAQSPQRSFGHVRGEDVVMHTRPAPVLHRFTTLPSIQALVGQVLAFCQFDKTSSAVNFDFTVPRQAFADARQLANAGSLGAATTLLAQNDVAPEAAKTLVAAWGASPTVSVLQTLTQQDNHKVRSLEFTLLQDAESAWWIAPDASSEAKGPIRVKNTALQEVHDLLIRIL